MHTEPAAFNLFDGTEVIDEPRRARVRDPETSKRAAASVGQFAGSHYAQIVIALGRAKELGAEQIAGITNIAAYQVRKRLPELEKECALSALHGRVAVVLDKSGKPKRRETATGRYERMWKLVPKKTETKT